MPSDSFTISSGCRSIDGSSFEKLDKTVGGGDEKVTVREMLKTICPSKGIYMLFQSYTRKPLDTYFQNKISGFFNEMTEKVKTKVWVRDAVE